MADYKAFIALVCIAGVAIGALLLAPAQSEDIFIISSAGNSSSSGVNSITSSNSAISVNATSGDILITPKWKLLNQNTTIGGNGNTIVLVNQNAGTATNLVCGASDGTVGCGERLRFSSTLVGKTVNKITVGLRKVSTPAVTLSICVLDASNNCLYTFGTMASASLTTSYTQNSFTGTGTWLLSSGETIGVKVPTLTGSNQVQICATTPSQFDSTNSFAGQYLGGWVNATAYDLGCNDANGAWKLENTIGTKFIESDFTSYKHLLVTAELRANNTDAITIRMNNDTGTNYALRTIINGVTSALVSESNCDIISNGVITSNDKPFLIMWIDNNQSGDRKIINGVFGYGVDTSATTAPSHVDFTCKWSNTANQINNIVINGDWLTGSIITVWGYD